MNSNQPERIYRHAEKSDLQAIYDIQNVPYRTEVFDSLLPTFEEFSSRYSMATEVGEEHYYLLEEQGKVMGFTYFSRSPDFWFASIWGKWLKTLTYASCIAAFDYLHFDRCLLGVRQSNRRMIRVLDEFGFRLIGETGVLHEAVEAPFLRKAMVNYYDIKPDEFWSHREDWRNKSLEITVQI